MEKFAVVEEDPKEKQGSETTACPRCGQDLKSETNVKICGDCGTAPFEGETSDP